MKIKEALGVAQRIRVRVESEKIPDHEMVDLMTEFIDILIEALVEAGEEINRLRAELDADQGSRTIQ